MVTRRGTGAPAVALSVVENTLMQIERTAFRTLAGFIEPWARAGCLSPAVWPVGIVVLETKGRTSGKPHRVSVLAMLVEQHLIVGTVRGARSDWMRNIAADPAVTYWLGGEACVGRAVVGAESRMASLSTSIRTAVAAMEAGAAACDLKLAVIAPDTLD